MVALFLLFASWLAYVIFEDTLQGQIVFTSYGTTLYEMFVLFTTSNNPDVWIPAYKVSRWYCLFFVLYMLLGVYFVTNLILAVVYDSFKSQDCRLSNGRNTITLKNLLILLKFQKEDTPSLFENCPNFYHSPASEKLKTSSEVLHLDILEHLFSLSTWLLLS
ncbi:hypothetical protein Leryth_005509 [Lithospermum erythrorhizon]|nr:hypothetical protein Leryth_005509 [Lithospermum erythrorhizon]